MAESVASLLRRSFDHVAVEVPESYRHLLRELGPLTITIEVDGELFSIRGGTRLDVADGGYGAAGVRVATSRSAIIGVLDAEVSLTEAVETGEVVVRGSFDDVVRAHDVLIAYVHAAVRAASVPGLLSAVRRGVEAG
jgi:hypothetical protein